MPAPPLLLDPHTGHLQLHSARRLTEKTTLTDLPGLFPAATITPYDLGNG